MNKNKIESSVLSIPYLIGKADLVIKLAGLKFFKDNGFDLTPEQADLLHILYQEDDITQTELAKAALKDKSNVARILSILENKKFIYRELSTVNSRMVKKVFITETGRAEIDKMTPLITELYDNVLNGITKKQGEDFRIFLETSINNVVEKYLDLDI